ncbi:MAG: enoyl-CoA hydratase/isomerase family protein [Halobacteriales archaeon]
MVNADFTVEEHVGYVTIQREEALNAIDTPTKREMIDTIGAWRDDDAVRAIVIRSAGEQAFCAGGDLKEVVEQDYSLSYFTDSWEELFEVMRSAPPIVARVDGYTLGGGFDLMLHCDVVVAAEDAQLGQPEVDLGIVNHFSPPLLLELVGLRKTVELMLTGETISGTEAERIGLVTRSVPADELDEAVDAVVESVRQKSPAIVQRVKDGIYTSLEMSPAAARDHLEAVALESARTEPYYKEGVDAQLEDREPDWSVGE